MSEFEGFILKKGPVKKNFGKMEKKSCLPSHETDCFHDGGLYDLFTREHTPSHGIWAVGVSVRLQIATAINDIVCNITIPFDVFQEKR